MKYLSFPGSISYMTNVKVSNSFTMICIIVCVITCTAITNDISLLLTHDELLHLQLLCDMKRV